MLSYDADTWALNPKPQVKEKDQQRQQSDDVEKITGKTILEEARPCSTSFNRSTSFVTSDREDSDGYPSAGSIDNCNMIDSYF